NNLRPHPPRDRRHLNKCFHNSLNTSSTYSSHCGSVRLLPCFCRLTDPPSTSKLLLRATRLIPSHPVLQCPSRRSLLTSHNLHRHRTLICHGNTSLSQLTRIIHAIIQQPRNSWPPRPDAPNDITRPLPYVTVMDPRLGQPTTQENTKQTLTASYRQPTHNSSRMRHSLETIRTLSFSPCSSGSRTLTPSSCPSPDKSRSAAPSRAAVRSPTNPVLPHVTIQMVATRINTVRSVSSQSPPSSNATGVSAPKSNSHLNTEASPTAAGTSEQ
ncbi:hypothetical protein TGGT1_411450, partial [Toxoplasma gondii GT1]